MNLRPHNAWILTVAGQTQETFPTPRHDLESDRIRSLRWLCLVVLVAYRLKSEVELNGWESFLAASIDPASLIFSITSHISAAANATSISCRVSQSIRLPNHSLPTFPQRLLPSSSCWNSSLEFTQPPTFHPGSSSSFNPNSPSSVPASSLPQCLLSRDCRSNLSLHTSRVPSSKSHPHSPWAGLILMFFLVRRPSGGVPCPSEVRERDCFLPPRPPGPPSVKISNSRLLPFQPSVAMLTHKPWPLLTVT